LLIRKLVVHVAMLGCAKTTIGKTWATR
jgi:hypothetical protein